ncbi:MAG: NAD-dependent epimerase/dehydratase family protein [Alphaproteobacteria bacterium]|nr:NAD-dependent epimerase/dehydratase family protein [Alphaproteobacteria bacterium]
MSKAVATILVTGASGFIGRSLVPQLVDLGFEVRAAVRDPHSLASEPGVVQVEMPDLASSQPDWGALLDGVDFIIHLAGIAHASSDIPDAHYQSVNGDAVGILATAAKAAGVKRVVYLSSVRAQSGPVATGVLDEESPAKPTDAYGRAKLAGEATLAAALKAGDTDWTTLRPVLVYGPGVKGNMAKLLGLARSKMPLPLNTLSGRRSILSVDNLISAVVYCLTSPQTSRRVFLVADLAPMRVCEIVEAMRRGLKRGPGLFGLPAAPLAIAARLIGKGDAWARLDGDLIVATDRLREAGWKPVVGSQKALADMARPASKNCGCGKSDPSCGH